MAASMAEDDSNTFRFLITTDNHLGYMEKDHRRGPDSFVSFEECLRAATVIHQTDAMLLGGDLFHENKPTLSTLTRTMKLMKRYVMGDRPVGFSMVSDPKVNFPRHPVPLANFQDPNINVALPIFMVHGNHDDPVGGSGSIDILASSSLVNYFGVADSVDDIILRPVLLQKGTTRVALYGLGNVRDERLHRAFKYNKVRFVKPKDGDNWFTVLLFHQNRGLRSGFTKAGIPEKMLQGFNIDLVIWGNEHEQMMTPQVSEGYDICQPGSSIMTSLSASESNPKQYGVLEIKGTAYRITGHNLQSCRPVVRRTVELWKDNPNGRSVAAVEAFLRKVADEMIEEAEQLIQHIPKDVLEYHENIKFPLMRLAVDFHDPDSPIGATYPIPNVNRFGQQFLDAVANASEVLKPIDNKKKRVIHQHIDMDVPAAPQNIPVTDIRAKVAAVLATNTRDSCQLLSEPQLSNAVYSFVEKGERASIHETIGDLLKASCKHVWGKVRRSDPQAGPITLEPQAIVDLAFEHKKIVNQKYSELQANQTGKGTSGAHARAVDVVQEIITRVQHDGAATEGTTAALPAVAVDVLEDDMPNTAYVIEKAAAAQAMKSAPKRSRAASTAAEPKAPATRGRKKEAAVPSQQGPALQMGGGGDANDILSMWNK